MTTLQNKVTIITGASTGLGKTLASKLAQEKMKLALIARSEDKLQELKKEFETLPAEVKTYQCDIRNLNEIKKTVADIMKDFGTIDIVINNAGVWSDENLEKENPELMQQAFDTNALGNIQFIYEVLPHLKKQNSGHILNVISSAGKEPVTDAIWKAYGATKWALNGFTKYLQAELQNTKIKVTAFFPGGFNSNLYKSAGRELEEKQPWMMKVEDVADSIMFCISRPEDVVIKEIVVNKVM